MNFITHLVILTNWKGVSYDVILFIINSLRNMVYYKLIKVIIHAIGLVKVILNIVM